jgi:hypothetical protein
MKNYDFTNEQVQLLKEAINAYSEMYSTGYRYNGRDTEERLNKMGQVHKILSNTYDFVNSEEEQEAYVYPICDY